MPTLVYEKIPDDEVWFVRPMIKFEVNNGATDPDTGMVVFDVEHEVLRRMKISDLEGERDEK